MISKPASRMGLLRPTSRVAASRAMSELEGEMKRLSRGIRVKDSCRERGRGEGGERGGREREREREGEREREMS